MIKPMESLEYLFSEENLRESWRNVAMKKSAPGIDDVSVDLFARNADDRLRKLHDSLVEGGYSPQPLIVFQKEKRNGAFRELTIPTVSDKIVAKTAADFEVRKFNYALEPQSYAYRPHRSPLKAVSVVEKALKSGEVTHVSRIDITDFFDTMNHSILGNMLLQFGNPSDMADLIMRFAKNPRFDGVKLSVPEAGVPQGSPVAPVLSNLYLDYFDKEMNRNVVSFLRYADDILLFAKSAEEAGNNMNLAIETLRSLFLEVSLDKSRIYDVRSGFVFLGFLFTPEGKTPCRESQDNLSRKLDTPKYDDETDMEYDKRIKSIVRGWNNYFHSDDQPRPEKPNTSSKRSDSVGFDWKPAEPVDTSLNAESVDLSSDSDFARRERVEAPNESPESDAASEDGALLDVIGDIEETIAGGRFSSAATKIRRVLSTDYEIDDGMRKSLYAKLADVYDSQGLCGAADRCRKTAGVGKVKSVYKSADEVVWGTNDPETWIDVFDSGSIVFRQYVDRVGRGGYKPASRSINPAYIRDHWLGKHTIAAPLFDKNNFVRFAVMDLDVSRKQLEMLTKSEIDELKSMLFDDAKGLQSIARKAGVNSVIEESGHKGYHLWFFMHQRQPAALAKDFLQALDRMAGEPPSGTHRELFPASDKLGDDKLNSRIKLPLGLHRVSGSYSRFLQPDGTEIKNPVHLLSHHTTFNKKRDMVDAIRSWNEFRTAKSPGRSRVNSSDNSKSHKVDELFGACAMLAALRTKAKRDHRLTHAERAVVRGVLAPLGEEGRIAIHSIMRECDNYSKVLTDKMLAGDRRKPMGCARVREILSYMAQKVDCDCRFRKKRNDYAHPLRHLPPVNERKDNGNSKKMDSDIDVKTTNKKIECEKKDVVNEEEVQCNPPRLPDSPSKNKTIALFRIILGSFKLDLKLSRRGD